MREENGFDYLNCMEKYSHCQNKDCKILFSLTLYKSGVTALEIVEYYLCKPNLNTSKMRSPYLIYKNTEVLKMTF